MAGGDCLLHHQLLSAVDRTCCRPTSPHGVGVSAASPSVSPASGRRPVGVPLPLSPQRRPRRLPRRTYSGDEIMMNKTPTAGPLMMGIALTGALDGGGLKCRFFFKSQCPLLLFLQCPCRVFKKKSNVTCRIQGRVHLMSIIFFPKVDLKLYLTC